MTTHLAVQPLTIVFSLVNRCLACRPDHLTVAVKEFKMILGYSWSKTYNYHNLGHELNLKVK